ncbi:hypothetical protein MRB53_017207 [Persea americana]|uniref:Uncharacterized protein n=1 Tax=Persea americana TaxID=3435 RepID=A0ACC2M4X3_PERAE|nr:hypothetical protein MRB53_017207 [Persea americana]
MASHSCPKEKERTDTVSNVKESRQLFIVSYVVFPSINGALECWDGDEHLRISIVVIHSDEKRIPQRSSAYSNLDLLSVIFSLVFPSF